MSGWNVPKLGAARINAACVLCIVLTGSLSLFLPGFIFFNLSILTLKVCLANLAFSVQGNPTLHTFPSAFTQLLFDVLFAFCRASSKEHWYNMGQGYLLTHRFNSLGVFTLSTLGCQIRQGQPGPAESPAQVREALGVFWAEQGLVRWQCPLRD